MWKNVLTVMLTAAALLCAQGPPTFVDEFNDNGLDLGKWSPHDPFGGKRSGDLALTSPDAITVSGGEAHLTARHEGGETPYVSGVMTTRGTFAQMYGRFEIRVRIPQGRGLDARFQLLPVSLKTLPGIDVFRVIGSEPAVARFESRWGDERTERAFGDNMTGPNLATGFHLIAMEWHPERITWFVDGKKTFESTEGVAHEAMFLALSLAVGGRLAKAPGPEVRFPAALDIDYIRVYRLP
jgi:beta-glucanase (GH16 family)